MKKLLTSLVVCALILSGGCVSSSAPIVNPGTIDQFHQTFEGVCKIYQKVRERYPQIKEAAILVHELGGIDDETWAALVELHRDAPKYDRWLKLFCDAEAGVANAHIIAAEKQNVDWDRVGAVVLKAAAFAIQQGLL